MYLSHFCFQLHSVCVIESAGGWLKANAFEIVLARRWVGILNQSFSLLHSPRSRPSPNLSQHRRQFHQGLGEVEENLVVDWDSFQEEEAPLVTQSFAYPYGGILFIRRFSDEDAEAI